MDPGPKPTMPPAAAAYLAALDAWLAAGERRNDTLVAELLDACADDVRALLPPEPTFQSMHPMHLPMAALLRLLR